MAGEITEKVGPMSELHNSTSKKLESSRSKSSGRHVDPCDPNIQEAAQLFRRIWSNATDDNHLTLFGFRRYRTAHLLNLRFLEAEVDKVEHKIFQAGLSLGIAPTKVDKLGLRHARLDASCKEGTIAKELIPKLRESLKQYDEALASFNNVMRMETFALADNDWQSSLRSDLNPYEAYKTRLVRVDLERRNGTRDLLQHSLRKILRAFWFFLCSRTNGGWKYEVDNLARSDLDLEVRLKRSYQNTAHLADIITRFLVALMTAIFLLVPLVILTRQSGDRAHLVTVSISILVFSVLLSTLTRASNQEIMAASAAYAAVLVVFVSNRSNA